MSTTESTIKNGRWDGRRADADPYGARTQMRRAAGREGDPYIGSRYDQGFTLHLSPGCGSAHRGRVGRGHGRSEALPRGSPRDGRAGAHTTIRLGTRTDREQTMDEKVADAQKKFGKAEPHCLCSAQPGRQYLPCRTKFRLTTGTIVRYLPVAADADGRPDQFFPPRGARSRRQRSRLCPPRREARSRESTGLGGSAGSAPPFWSVRFTRPVTRDP